MSTKTSASPQPFTLADLFGDVQPRTPRRLAGMVSPAPAPPQHPQRCGNRPPLD